ncbi:MAG: alpha/beta hydrolase [Chloroflexi bacterium]|nr:alpha/beta hydrolase [Chloroflexota bacterium]
MATRVKPQDKTVNANGINIHYLDWGNPGKPSLVMIHGLRGHAHSWDDVSAAVCQDYHVLALDQRGRGETDWAKDGDYSTDAYVADMDAFCRVLGMDRFILMGHSMGGRNSMTFAGKYPDKLEKLIIVDMGPETDPRGGKRISQEIIDVPEEFDAFEAVVEYMLKQNRFASETVIRRRLQYATKELPNGKIGWRYDLAIREARRNPVPTPPQADLWPVLTRIPCPTLVVRGMETDLLTAEVAQRMVRELPQGQLVEIPNAGHMVFEDNPEDFITAVRKFLG